METEKYYDSISSGYNALYGKEQMKKYINVPFEEISGKTALDLGCGTGLLIPLIDTKFKFIVGLDISLEMLKLCPKYGNVRYVKADATCIPFQDNSFNYVFSFSVLQDLKEKEKFVEEVWRICKDKAIISVLKKNKSSEDILKIFKKFFIVEEFIEEEKDFVMVLKKIKKEN